MNRSAMGERRIIRGTWLDVFICSTCREPSEGRAVVVAGELAVCYPCVVDELHEIARLELEREGSTAS